jgi:hypothetical protein
MTRERLHEIVDLVIDASEILEDRHLRHNVEISVGRYPEVRIRENIGCPNDRVRTYYGYTPIWDTTGQNVDIVFDLAEKHLRELIERIKEE